MTTRLSKDQITIGPCSDGKHVVASLFEEGGYRVYQKISLAVLPNDLVDLHDLERFGIDTSHMKPIRGLAAL